MKRFYGILLVCIMLVSLVACGGEKTDKENENGASTGETMENQVDVSGFEEITVVDNAECMIKVTGIEPENLFGYTLKVYLENKSESMTYMFSLEEASVDGVETEPLFASELAPGKKENASISFMDTALEENNLLFTDIELFFEVYDSNDYSAEPVAKEKVHVYPQGKEAAVVYEREDKETDKVLIDNEYLKVVLVQSGEHDLWGYVLDLYVINKTDKELMISFDDVAINDFMLDPFFAHSVPAGKKGFASVFWSADAFEENKIEKVEKITFTLAVRDANDWMAEDIVNESITINP